MKTALLLGILVLLAGCTTTISTNDTMHVQAQDAATDSYEFKGITQWFNLEGISENDVLTKQELKGKVVLVDFWTYSCINCIRTLPYTTSWDKKYRDDGLVIVGIHAPEFAFEHDPDNVAKALIQYNISYPVGLDNDFSTWKVYKNSYWPHIYLFDRSGKFVYDHIGEGGDEEIETKIQELLAVKKNMTELPYSALREIGTPEIYLAQDTRGNIGYDATGSKHEFSIPFDARINIVYLGGSWDINEQDIQAKTNSTLFLRFHAKDIHVVAGGSGEISGTIDGTSLSKTVVYGERLYTLSSTDYADHDILLNISPGIHLYTFTFG